MLKKTIATMFSCGGGFDLGAIAAGYNPIFGIDNNAVAVECYRKNIGNDIVLGDVRQYDYTGIKASHLHASPSCKTSSSANTNKGETEFDIECADAVCRAIAQIQPETFTLENVEGYRNGKAFYLIGTQLISSGYTFRTFILNAADYGVGQTRKRFIVMASKNKSKHIPEPRKTHSNKEDINQFSLWNFNVKPWVSWYSAIADLIPTLKESKLADWQLKKLPNEIKESFMIDGRSGCNTFSMTVRDKDSPAFTVISSISKGMTKIFLFENTGARSDRPLQYRTATKPSWTIRALGHDSHWHKANILQLGKVYQLNTRCLARLMSVPDSYILPDRNSEAGSILGNMVPPLMAEAIMRGFDA